jgi:hypothetical protein
MQPPRRIAPAQRCAADAASCGSRSARAGHAGPAARRVSRGSMPAASKRNRQRTRRARAVPPCTRVPSEATRGSMSAARHLRSSRRAFSTFKAAWPCLQRRQSRHRPARSAAPAPSQPPRRVRAALLSNVTRSERGAVLQPMLCGGHPVAVAGAPPRKSRRPEVTWTGHRAMPHSGRLRPPQAPQLRSAALTSYSRRAASTCIARDHQSVPCSATVATATSAAVGASALRRFRILSCFGAEVLTACKRFLYRLV